MHWAVIHFHKVDNSEDPSDVTDDFWLANRTSFRVRSLRMDVRLTVANQNRTQIHAIVYKQKPSLYKLVLNQSNRAYVPRGTSHYPFRHHKTIRKFVENLTY